MMEFLDEMILDNPVKNYLKVAAVILIVFMLKRIISLYLVSLLLKIFNNAGKIDSDRFKKLVVKPVGWVLVIVVSVIAFDKLYFPGVWHFRIYGYSTKEILNALGICIMIIALIRFLLRTVDFIALIMKQAATGKDDRSEYQMISFFRDFLKVAIGIFGTLWLIRSGLGKPVGPLLTGLSIVGAALALAAKESLENLIASFIIFFDKPFFVGDFLKVNNVSGTVERIGLRSTRIRTTEKTLVTIPNKQMVDGIVDNVSMRTQLRAEIKIELNINTDPAKLDQLVNDTRKWLQDRKDDILTVSVFLQDYSKNGVTLFTEYFTPPANITKFNEIRQKLILYIRQRIEEIGLELQTGATDIRFVKDDLPQPPPPNPII
ncbi:MAG: mechanosensitive ion channel [Chitinophagaceae bacterium]|nr:MAG: mechanosensitive ion channel [Chitinophagaceae bacterium]